MIHGSYRMMLVKAKIFYFPLKTFNNCNQQIWKAIPHSDFILPVGLFCWSIFFSTLLQTWHLSSEFDACLSSTYCNQTLCDIATGVQRSKCCSFTIKNGKLFCFSSSVLYPDTAQVCASAFYVSTLRSDVHVQYSVWSTCYKIHG